MQTIGPKKLPSIARRNVSDGQAEWVQVRSLFEAQPIPLAITSRVPDLALADWASPSRAWVDELLTRHRALLFRGFRVDGAVGLERVVQALSDRWTEYREPATPRTQVQGNIFTSTDYPPEHAIFLHNENSHCESWPLKIFFHCVEAAPSGGRTPIADCRRVLARIPADVREAFRARQVMYVRNFGDGLGIPWQTVFKTTDRAEVDDYCRRSAIVAEWKSADRLRIRYVRPAIARHPATGEELWFNHATFFHTTTLDARTRDVLRAHYAEEDLPYQTYFGDGSSIEPHVVETLRQAYDAETVRFDWMPGDVLLLDNMSIAHGREPFSGSRRVLVGLADPCASRL